MLRRNKFGYGTTERACYGCGFAARDLPPATWGVLRPSRITDDYADPGAGDRHVRALGNDQGQVRHGKRAPIRRARSSNLVFLFTNNCRVALPKARSGLLRQAVTANPTVISEMGPLSVRVSGFPMPTALPAAEELHAKAPRRKSKTRKQRISSNTLFSTKRNESRPRYRPTNFLRECFCTCAQREIDLSRLLQS